MKNCTKSVQNIKLNDFEYNNYASLYADSPFINGLYLEEERNNNEFTTLIISSAFKLIFMQVIAISVFYILMNKKYRYINLMYSRGMGISLIKHKMIKKELYSMGVTIILSITFPLLFSWSKLQFTQFLSIVLPWIVLYSLSVTFIVNNRFRIYHQKLINHNSNLTKKNKFKIYKILLLGVLILLIFTLINLESYFQMVSLSSFQLYLYWFLALSIITLLVFFIEGEIVEKKSSKYSPIIPWMINLRKYKYIILLFVLLIAANASIGQTIVIYNDFYGNNSDILGSIGDYTITTSIYNNENNDKFNISKFYDIDGIQSVLPVYSNYIILNDLDNRNSDQLAFVVNLVNQSIYDVFISKNSNQFHKELFFKDKLWVPLNYYPGFKYRTSPFNIYIGDKQQEYSISSNNFEMLTEKSGLITGSNTIIGSIETWNSLNLPMINFRSISIQISFVETLDKDIALTRISNAINIPQNQIFLKKNDNELSKINVDNSIVFNNFINILFNAVMALAILYLLIDENITRSIKIYNRKYGIKQYRYLFTINILFSSTLLMIFGIVGIFLSYVGTQNAIKNFYFYLFKWSIIFTYSVVTLIPQIVVQLFYSLYLIRKTK